MRRLAVLAIVLMTVGVVGPWAKAEAKAGTIVVSGLERDGWIPLLILVAAVVFARSDYRITTAILATAAEMLTLLMIYSQGESLLGSLPANEVNIAWGGVVSLLAPFVLFAAAARGGERTVLPRRADAHV